MLAYTALLAGAYVQADKPVPAVIPLTAPTRLEQLRENLGALDLELTAEQLAELSDAGSS